MSLIADTGFVPSIPQASANRNPESESVHSSDSSSYEDTTNATESDLVGVGRLVGHAYSRAGRAVEIGIAKVARRIRARRERSPEAIPDQSTSVELQVLDDTRQGARQRYGRTSTSRTGSSIRRAFSFSTVSADQTATNLPGTGRILGKVYAAGGRAIESYINKRAIKAGRGPDACAKRIRESIIGEPYPDEMLGYLHIKVQGKRLDLLSGFEEVLFKECLRLSNYAKSNTPSTHNRAMQLISELAIEDRYTRTLLNGLGAPGLLEEVRKRQLKLHNVNSDWFLPHCRKAIISLSSNEINNVMFRNLRASDNLSIYLVYSTLEKFFHDPEQSFLAIRYLRRSLKRPVVLHNTLYKIPLEAASEIFGRVADLVFSLPHIVEWDCLDDIFFTAARFCYGYFEERGDFGRNCEIQWNKVFASILRHPNRLPITVDFITSKTNISRLLDPADIANQRSKMLFETRILMMPDGTSLDQSSVTAATSFPNLLLGLHKPIASLADGNSENALITSRYENFRTFNQVYSHPGLERICDHLSIGPDVVGCEILGLRNTNWRSTEGRLYAVPREPGLSLLCSKLLSFLASPDPDLQARTLRWIHRVSQLDRYSMKALRKASARMLSDSISSSTTFDRISPNLSEQNLGNLDNLKEGLPVKWLYRHKLPGGSIYVQITPIYDIKPCPICMKVGANDGSSNSNWACSETFYAPRQLILLLEIRPDEVFRVAGHRPVLANVTDTGEREYIATVMDESAVEVPYAYSTVADGAATIDYLDESGKKSTTDHFWVFVLRYDMIDDDVKPDKGVEDVTGACYWQRRKSPAKREEIA